MKMKAFRKKPIIEQLYYVTAIAIAAAKTADEIFRTDLLHKLEFLFHCYLPQPMNKISKLFPVLYKTHHFFLLHTLSTLSENPNNLQPKPPAYLLNHPLNLDHPILSKLQKCQNPTQFNQIHGLIITLGMAHNVFVASRLILTCSFSLNPPNNPLAHLLFSQIQNPDVYTYNIIIKASSSQTSNPIQISLSFYQKMLIQDLQPNEYTFCFLLTSCANGSSLQVGRQIHSQFIKHGFNLGIFASTSLVQMYSKSGDLDDALQAFDEMHQKNDISWSVIIDGYVSNGFLLQGLGLFAEKMSSGIEASNSTLVSILCACSRLQDLSLGRMIHGYIEVRGLELNVTLGTSLVDMYSKCGTVEIAMDVFSRMLVKSVASWNCMINGLAINGQAETAIELFGEMQRLEVKPNGGTFVGVLHACSHTGMVDEGLKYFSSMSEVDGVEPNVKHYGCLVDLYARAGCFEQALETIQTMPMNPDAITWGALLGACRIHGKSELGAMVVAQMMKLQPNSITVSGLADMYAMAGQWDDVAGARRKMLDIDIVKVEPGFSSISN